MIFFRSSAKPGPRPMHVRRVRWLSILALTAYPAGSLIVLNAGEANEGLAAMGYAVVLLAVAAFLGIISTGVQRITAEQKQHLDSEELLLRQQAYSRSFHVIGSAALLSVLYLQLAEDAKEKIDLWTPSTSDHWTAIMWGAILFIYITPALILSWSLPAQEIDGED